MDYEVATDLDKKSQAVRLATLRSVIGKDCLQIFLNWIADLGNSQSPKLLQLSKGISCLRET